MTEGFQPRRGGGAVATFTGFEADLLRSLAAQLVELLSSESSVGSTDADPLEALVGASGPTTPPEDPVLARLLPSAYRDDDEAAGEFRRFTEGQLRSGKVACAGAVIVALEEAGLPEGPLPPGPTAADPDADGPFLVDVELGRGQVIDWMRALTDMRLALATRLGIEQDDDELWDSLPDDDPRVQVHDIYDWLGFVQETLVRSATT